MYKVLWNCLVIWVVVLIIICIFFIGRDLIVMIFGGMEWRFIVWVSFFWILWWMKLFVLFVIIVIDFL